MENIQENVETVAKKVESTKIAMKPQVSTIKSVKDALAWCLSAPNLGMVENVKLPIGNGVSIKFESKDKIEFHTKTSSTAYQENGKDAVNLVNSSIYTLVSVKLANGQTREKVKFYLTEKALKQAETHIEAGTPMSAHVGFWGTLVKPLLSEKKNAEGVVIERNLVPKIEGGPLPENLQLPEGFKADVLADFVQTADDKALDNSKKGKAENPVGG